MVAHSCLLKSFEYGAMKSPLDTNNKKDERRRGGRTEGHLAKPTALKASRHGRSVRDSCRASATFFCVWGILKKFTAVVFYGRATSVNTDSGTPMACCQDCAAILSAALRKNVTRPNDWNVCSLLHTSCVGPLYADDDRAASTAASRWPMM